MSEKSSGSEAAFGSISEVDWFRQSFDADYIWLYAHRSDREAANQVRVAIKYLPFKAGQKILDIACGAGRHMLAFAKRGAKMTGIDLSPTLLRIAREKFSKAGLAAGFRLEDMRKIGLKKRFDGATLWFTSFGYFPTIADDQKVLRNLAERLRPGGWWWIDLPHPIYLEDNLVTQSERRTEGPNGRAVIMENRRIVGRRVIKTTSVEDRLGRRVFREYVRLYRPEQFGTMVRKVGLATDGILGDYDGSALARCSPRQIWFGRKRK